jgi:NADH dehydrogenase
MSQSPAQVVVVGSGFAGFFAARKLARILPRELAEVTMVSATDHLGYSPLLPEVAAGRLDPQRIAVPLHGSLGCSRILQGRVEDVDFESRKVRVACGEELSLPYDRLVLATGSVTRGRPRHARAHRPPGRRPLRAHHRARREITDPDIQPGPR